MKLEQAITVMNQFSNTTYHARGGTPAHFVEEYMARNNATLTTYPVDTENFSSTSITSSNSVYQAQRDKLLNRRNSYDPKRPTDQDWFNLTTLEGRSFSQDGISLSKGMIKDEAQQMQHAYNEGHTVLTLVTSFDNDYLKSLNVEKKNAKNFHQDVDEMKLRLAVKRGCHALSDSLGYTKPLFIGSIQLDRDHPHAHIAMCETAPRKKSNAKFFYDGHEWGTLSKADRNNMRQAINNNLEIGQSINFFPSNQVENAQKTDQLYSNRFATLRQQKEIIAINALQNENGHEMRVREDLVQDLADTLATKSHKKRNEIRHEIRKQNPINKNRKFKLPTIINLQLQRLEDLDDEDTHWAKMIAKMKRAKAKERAAKLKESQIAEKLQQIRRLADNNPKNKHQILSHIMPYYQAALSNSATEVDHQRLFQYQPVKDIPNSTKNDYQDLKGSLAVAQTPFQQAEAKERANDMELYWHLSGYTNYQDIESVANDTISADNLPVPKTYALKDLKPKVTEQDQANELQALYEAWQAKDAIPDTWEGKQIKDDLENQIKKQKQKQEDKNKNIRKQIKKEQKKKLKQYYSVSYKKADDLLLSSVNG